jgi:ABC-type sugar transport system substrate-binding protein
VTATVLCAASCSSSPATSSAATSSAATSAPASSASCTAAADAFLKPYDTLAAGLPTSLIPLATRPKPGGSVIDVVGPVPSEAQIADAELDAAKAIGWTAGSVHDDGAVENVNAMLEQAIAEHPTMITLSGYPAAALSHSLADAKKAGVVVVLGAQTEQPTDYPGFAAAVGGQPTYELMGRIDAYEFMRASRCSGAVDVVTLAGYPVLQAGDAAFTATVSKYCPACKVSVTPLQAADIGTAAGTNAIVSQLQSDPSIGYVRIDIGSVASGLSAALNQTGLQGIKIFGDVPDEAAIASLRGNSSAWWVNYSSTLFGYALIDAGLRAMQSRAAVPDTGAFPLALLTPSNVPSGPLPVIPADYQQLFKQLWVGQ